MTKEEKKKAEKKILILSLVPIILLGVFLIFCFASGHFQSPVFTVGVSLLLALYWVIADMFPVVWTKCFEGKDEMQKQAYYMYVLIDLAGLAGLVYFLVDLESTAGAIIYAASIFLKRNFKDKFDGKAEEKQEQEQEQEQEQSGTESPDTEGRAVEANALEEAAAEQENREEETAEEQNIPEQEAAEEQKKPE